MNRKIITINYSLRSFACVPIFIGMGVRKYQTCLPAEMEKHIAKRLDNLVKLPPDKHNTLIHLSQRMLKSRIKFLNKSRVLLAPGLNNKTELKILYMKKIYLLFAVALITISASAQNVILRVDNNYDLSIDGRNYEGNSTIPNLGPGQHTVNVYEVKKGFLGIGKKRNLVSTSNFELRNNDVTLEVDQYGQLRINEAGNYNTQNRRLDRTTDRDYDKTTDRGYDRNAEKNGKGYGPHNNPGKGNKYGLYKDKNNKVDKSQKANKGKGKK